jgi:outer membrane protein TolC
MRNTVLTVILISSCWAQTQPGLTLKDAQAQPLALRDAQAELFKNNLDIMAAEVDLQKANDEMAVAQSAWWPSLDASASYNYLTEKSSIHIENLPFPGNMIDRTIGANTKADFGLDMTCPLFTGFSRYCAVRNRKAAVAEKQARLDAIKNRASFCLGLLYLQWELSYKQTDLRKSFCEQLDTWAKQIAAQREAGVALQSKLLDAQARLQLAKVDLIAAKDQSDSLRREVLSFILSKENEAAPDTAPFAIETLPLPKSVDYTRPELIALDQASAQIDELRKALRFRHFPTLAGLAGVRYGRPGLNMGLDRYMGYGLFGLQLKWNLFDGFRMQAENRQLLRQIDFIDIERTRQTETLQRTFAIARQQVSSAINRLAATVAAAHAARALAEDLKNSLAAGTVTSADYMNALVNVAQAELLVEQAKTAKKIALLKMQYSAGKAINY